MRKAATSAAFSDLTLQVNCSKWSVTQMHSCGIFDLVWMVRHGRLLHNARGLTRISGGRFGEVTLECHSARWGCDGWEASLCAYLEEMTFRFNRRGRADLFIDTLQIGRASCRERV